MFGGNRSGFGTTNTFGSPSNTGFGGFGQNTNNTSPFGGTTGGFGTTNTTTSPFGATTNTTSGGFGSTSATGFGSSTTNTGFGGFGSNTNTNQSGFGFGGTSTTPNTGFGTSTMTTNANIPGSGTGNVNYQQTKSGIEEKLSYNYLSITTMPQFSGTNTKTIEELRLLDYGIGGQGQTSGFGGAGTGSMFGGTTSTGAFGSTTTSGNMFGGTTGTTGGFGTTSTGGGMFGNNNSAFGGTTTGTSAFGGTTTGGFGSTTSGGLFGNKPATTGGGLFGSNTTNTGFGQTGAFGSTTTSTPFGGQTTNTSGGLFGSSTTSTGFGGTTNTGGGLFGSKPATTGTGLFGSTTTTNTGGGLFGNNTQQSSGGLFGNTNKPSGGLFGSTTPSTGGGLFGSTTQQSSGGLFGSTNKPSGGLFGSTPSTGGGLFGNTQQSSGGLFGSTTTSTGGGLFGSTTTGSSNLFGGTSTTAQQPGGANADILKLINLAGYAKNSNIEMKRHLELAKRAWNPSSSLTTSTDSGSKKFKFQVTTTKRGSGESDPLAIKKKFEQLKPDKHRKPQVQSIGALVVRSAQKKQKSMQKLRQQTIDKKLKFIANPNLLKLTDKFTIDKSKRQNVLLIENKPILDEAKEQEEATMPQKLLFTVKPTGTEAKALNPNAPTLADKLKEDGYRTIPDIEALKRMTDDELSKVKDFAVVRENYGGVMFPGEVDVRNIDLSEDMIEIGEDSVEVYKTEQQTPPVGKGLNRRAEITIKNVSIPLGFVGGEEEFVEFLKNVYTPKIGGKFISYHLDQSTADEKMGTWKFQVDHFTKYGFDESAFQQHPKKQKVSTSLPISFLQRLDQTVTSSFWKREESSKLALESLALFRKFQDESENGVTLEKTLLLLQEQIELSEPSSCEEFLVVFEFLEACFLVPFHLLEYSTGEQPSLELLVTVLKSQFLETLPTWYNRWKGYIKSETLDKILSDYDDSTCLHDIIGTIDSFEEADVFSLLLKFFCDIKNESSKLISNIWNEQFLPDIVIFQLCNWLIELGLLPDNYECRESIVLSIITSFIANKSFVSDDVMKHNVFIACLELTTTITMEKSQFEFLLRSYLFDVSSLSESRTIMSQIKQIADQLDASNEFETICNLLKGQQTFLIFKTPEELETILTKALENKDFESFQLLVIKALRVGVFDKREDIPEVIVRALETAYDQGFSFSKTTNTLLLKIQEMFMHIRNLLSIIYKLLRKDSSHKLPVDTYQKLFVLVNELYNDIDKLKTEGEGIGLTYISHIEKELEKVQPDFQFIFGALENMYVDPKIDFFDEVKRLHLEALKEIYS